MKSLVEELALTGMGTADVNAITPKVLATAIEEIRRSEKVWGQFYKENKDLMRNGGTEVVFGKKQYGIVCSWGLAPGQGATQSSIKFDAATIIIAKGAVGIAITGEAIRQVNRDVIADNILEAGLVYRDTLDILAMEKMFLPLNVVAASSFAACNGTVCLGVKGTLGDWSSGSIVQDSSGCTIGTAGHETAATVTIWYAPSTTNKRAAGTTNGTASISPRDVLKLRADIVGYNYNPDVMVMHPDMFAEFIYDPTVKFVGNAEYASPNAPIWNGELGRVWGIRVIVSNRMPQLAIALIDSKNLGYEIVRKELDLKRDEYTGASADVLYFWGFAERNFGVVNTRAYGVVYAIGTFATGNWEVQGSAFGPQNP